MRKKLWAILVLTTLVASILVGCSEECGSTLTILSISEGSVFVMEGGTDSWEEAQVGMSLEPGDSIKTGSNSSAEITFFDGSTIELEAGAEIEIISLDISADCTSTTITLEQTIGTTISRVTKLLDPASRYEVETPSGVGAVRGSSMLVQVFPDGSTLVTNLAGEIWVTADGVELQIPEGRVCIMRTGQPPQLMPFVYILTITSTAGGSVTTPGEDTFTYDEGTVVNLVAEAEEGYRFGNWTGDVGTIANVNAATTTITMDGDYSITANFAEAIVVSLRLHDIPSTLPFNRDFVSDNDLEYEWAISIDVDNNPDTGSSGYDVTISLSNFKYPGATPTYASIVEGTQHNTWVWEGDSFTWGHEIDVTVDYASNTITMVASKAWEELSNLDDNSRFDFGTYYYAYAPDGVEGDDTADAQGSEVIHDPMGDVPYDFVDIIQGSLQIGPAP